MNKRISVGAAANYIVFLYDKLNHEYLATPIFVEKLVFIANLRYFCEMGYCFLPVDTQYISYPLGVVGLKDTIRSGISSGTKVVNKYNYLLKEKYKLTDNDIEIGIDYKMGDFLQEIKCMDSSVKNILLETFIAFGSYGGAAILDMYIEIINVTKLKNIKKGYILNEFDLKNLIPKEIVKNDLYNYIFKSNLNVIIETELSKETIDFIEDILQMSLEQFNSLKYSEKEEVSNRINSQKSIEKRKNNK